MCFSAGASFASGVVISSIGAVTVKNVKKPKQLLFAGIPLVFGVQQISEGMLWLSLSHPEYAGWQNAGSYLFLMIARVLWPLLMPLAVMMMEENTVKKKQISVFLFMGLAVSLYYTYCLLFLNVVPQIAGRHIQYISDFPDALAVPVFFLYVIASIAPLFISSIQRTKLLGILFFVSSIVTVFYFREYVTSVWCFFAAVISAVVYWIVKKQ